MVRIRVTYNKMCGSALGPGRRCCLFPTSKNSYNVICVARAIFVCVGAIILSSRNEGLGPMMLILLLRNQGDGLVLRSFLEILDRITS